MSAKEISLINIQVYVDYLLANPLNKDVNSRETRDELAYEIARSGNRRMQKLWDQKGEGFLKKIGEKAAGVLLEASKVKSRPPLPIKSKEQRLRERFEEVLKTGQFTEEEVADHRVTFSVLLLYSSRERFVQSLALPRRD